MSARVDRKRGPASGTTAGPRERLVRVAGLSLHVRETGDGHPVLLVNGIGAHSGMWRPLERAVPDARLIGFDAPGSGRSDTPLMPLTLDRLAGVAEALLDRLGHDRADVLGYSFGGIVAQRLAHRAPARVRRLVLAATTPGWGGVPGSLLALIRMSTPLRYYWPWYYESIVGDLMGGRARFDREFVRRQSEARRGRPPNPLGYAWQVAALAGDPGTLPWLHTLRQPTLVIAGDDDPVLPLANSLLLAHRIPIARLVVVPDGHLLLFDSAGPALPVIRDFLGSDDYADSRAWTDAVDVSARMVEDALHSDGVAGHHPVALMSAAVRALWRR